MYGPKELHTFRDPWRQPVGFWMDILCVPVGDKHKELRKQAINQMREIYEGADRVLVLDDWLEDLSLSSSIYEKATRIYLSNWQHRPWTLQEGALAQQLSIQFKDGPMTLDEIKDESFQAVSNGPSPQFYCGITRGLSVVPIFNRYFALDRGVVPAVGDLFSPLIPTIQGRATTKLEDETVYMATLLRLDTEGLQTISTSSAERKKMTETEAAVDDARICAARMKKFLCMVGSFEQRIIFNHLPRMTIDGFRWAPRSFLGQSKPLLVATADSGWNRKERQPPATILTERGTNGEDDGSGGGLVVTYPAIKLRNVTPSQLRAGTVYMSRQGHSSFPYRVSLDIPSDYGPAEASQYGPSGYALVTSDVLCKDSGKPIPSIFGILRGQTQSGIHRLQHICLATVEAPDQSEAEEQILKESRSRPTGISTNSEEVMSDEETSGEWLKSKKNKWCTL
ncbi:hypothetical protein CLCR_02440 [Cladophialophora carrionii]|uniref:Heterokaryon incompatibility domain-containing protein n=1 Tax=Cladophialophora carrionii TaxID=86049 RepID=A0A1C1CF49_9EURO|nr:hypothetical protein CLCR_02440 [Cladophialophora carrionii]